MFAVELADRFLLSKNAVRADDEQRLVTDHADVWWQRPGGHSLLLNLKKKRDQRSLSLAFFLAPFAG
jgi:hypothetical protein